MDVHVIPPVVEVHVSSSVDVMRASDAARRVADLQGFSPIYQAMAAGAALSLAEWLCRTQEEHVIEFYGIQGEQFSGFRMDCHLNWLKDAKMKDVGSAMLAKLSGLVDEVEFSETIPYLMHITLWLNDERKAIIRMKDET